MKYFTVFFLTIIVLLIGCKDSEKVKYKTVKTSATAEKVKYVKEKVSSEEVASLNTHKVIVLEKIATGGYIYLKVSEKEKEYWMAVPERQIKIGATYYYDGGMVMANFESKTLKRTFERIIFAQGVREKKNELAIQVIKKSTDNKGTFSVINIEKATNGIRIATLFKNPKAYQNKKVIIKGKVVKVNNGIMGVNFIHLQDGTKGKGKYDVTVTSSENFKIEDVVTIKGTVVLDKDFGAGYTYDLIIEKATAL